MKTYAQKKAEALAALEDEYAAEPEFARAEGHALSAAEKEVIENKGTEPAGTGKYDKFHPTQGFFACRKCGTPIYSHEAKFESGCGWPAFDRCYEGAIATREDTADGLQRIEIVCASCGGHLGHVFTGEKLTDSNERHCANSRALQYVKGVQVDKRQVVIAPALAAPPDGAMSSHDANHAQRPPVVVAAAAPAAAASPGAASSPEGPLTMPSEPERL